MDIKNMSSAMHKGKTKHIRKRSLSDYLLLVSKGFCMGASDVVPGVSGGTMAFILGIYEELINAIKSFDLKSLQLLLTLKVRPFLDRISWKFLISVGIGILTAIFTLSKVLSWLLQNKPVLIWSFFLGLILASVLSVSRRVEVWRLSTWTCLSGGILGTYFLVGFVPVSTPNEPWFLFLSGAVAICAMILPGISGAFILVLLGKYQVVLEAVNQRDLTVLLLVFMGAYVGITTFSRLLSWLFKKYHDLTVALLTGFMLGSLRKVWPWKETLKSVTDIKGKIIPIVQENIFPSLWNIEVTNAICLITIGFLIVFSLDYLAARKK